ncbi:centrosomal protein of 78 kDa-like, partial [Limulus polyphemus]|uniref:Centrosomal protein of 78 kDa-like n=1 Tax=Limulus polyphemus TaxID=6850 RepID=A0ABM1TS12_LIMPO
MRAASASLQNKEGKSRDFVTSYNYHCEIYNVCPHRTILSSVKGQVLDLETDRLKIEDWPPFCKALGFNRNLKWISLKSNYFKNHPEFRGDSVKFQLLQSANKLIKLPAVLRVSVLDSLCQSLVKCLNQIEELVGLELVGLPLADQQITDLTKAFQSAGCLRHISLSHCTVGKGGIEAICKALRNTLSVSLSSCGITVQGAVCIASVLKFQSIKRYSEAWQESLRYRCPNLDRLSGLRRITLNNNPDIADDGAVALANVLQEDLWLKALDLQNCGIGVKGAEAFLATLDVNVALEILDLRGNSKIGGQLIQKILEKLKRNNEGKLCE